MMRADLHTHTVFCDGQNTPEEMVLAALEKGMDCIGFSGHSYTACDDSWCMSESGTVEYRRTVSELKEKYRGKIRILCGIEKDFFSEQDTSDFDFVIGSVHYLKIDGVFIPVDESPNILRKAASLYYGGDIYALAEDYYRTVAQVVNKTGANIIGHFDLITKFVETDGILDVREPRYIIAWKKAVNALLPEGRLFELNTGAISRGYRTSPYPEPAAVNYIRENGGKILLSSDSHSRDTIGFGFEQYEQFATEKTWPGKKRTTGTENEGTDRTV